MLKLEGYWITPSYGKKHATVPKCSADIYRVTVSWLGLEKSVVLKLMTREYNISFVKQKWILYNYCS